MLVVDASIAVKWFVREAGHEQASAIARAAERLAAPDRLLLEVANVLRRKMKQNETAPDQARLASNSSPITSRRSFPQPSFFGDAFTLAERLDHSRLRLRLPRLRSPSRRTTADGRPAFRREGAPSRFRSSPARLQRPPDDVRASWPSSPSPRTPRSPTARPGRSPAGANRTYARSASIAGTRTTAQNPRIDTYYVDLDDCGPMVLDALIKIKNEIDPTLTFRRSCREGICGSCAMNIDGTNTLACTKAHRRRQGRPVKIYPLPHMPVVKDLVPDLTNFYAQYASIEPWLQDRDRRRRRKEWQQSHGGPREARRALRVHPVRLLLDRPARATGGTATAISARRSLLQAYRWIIDSRDEATGERLDKLEDPFRLYRCHTIMNCAKACPKGLNPAKAIAEIKKMMVERAI